jgi:hypothetical protein
MRSRTLYALVSSCYFLFHTTAAQASGDPIVIYFAAGGGLVQMALLIFILAAKAFRQARTPSVIAFLIYLGVLWGWVWQSMQSAAVRGAALVVLPCLVVGALLWLLVAVDRRTAAVAKR